MKQFRSRIEKTKFAVAGLLLCINFKTWRNGVSSMLSKIILILSWKISGEFFHPKTLHETILLVP